MLAYMLQLYMYMYQLLEEDRFKICGQLAGVWQNLSLTSVRHFQSYVPSRSHMFVPFTHCVL